MKLHRQAHIYLPDSDRPAILVPLYDAGGSFVCHQEKNTVLKNWHDPVKLGLGVRAVLKKFADKPMKIRGGGSVRTTPVFIDSGCKTVKEFASTYLQIVVCAQNESELFFDASTRPYDEGEITLKTTLDPCGLDVEIGRKLLRLHEACVKWSEHMV